ncbi:glycosyltransferase [Streptomonospora nanhaiensis]|uniref:Glycosyltransferase n=1 Tax=Streptomonospora nanhaiensis TaxID=1323731 RepID=A0ABY6YKJ8_9ACTN|nr:glycosyltransferase [Streptomonospora nanhaiensis]WAE72829.1 glycosyltransferase [Streptomonospora nanhaiensis]
MSTSFASASPTTAPPPRPAGGPERRPRVLIGTDTYPPDVNGAAYFTERLARGLAGRGARVHVVCPSPEGSPRTVERDGVVEHRLRSMSSLVHDSVRLAVPLGVRGHLDLLLDRLEPDAVHIQNHFLVGRMLAAAARARGVPVVATNHFMPENLFDYVRVPGPLRPYAARIAWWDLGAVLSRTEHVTTPTPAAAGLLREQGFAKPVEPVSCGVDLAGFSPLDGGAATKRRLRARLGVPDRTTVLFVGRLDEEKRAEELVRATARTASAQLLLAGHGAYRRSLEELAVAEGVADRVVFLGFVSQEDLPDVYRCADVFAIAGVAELQSIATLEAMASGLPVVAADAMALPHLVEEGRNGYLYRPGSPEELAARIEDVVADEGGRLRMGEHSRAMASRHRLEDSLERFERIYLEAAEGTAVPASAAAGAVLSG